MVTSEDPSSQPELRRTRARRLFDPRRRNETKVDLRSALEIELREEAFFLSRGNAVESLILARRTRKRLALS